MEIKPDKHPILLTVAQSMTTPVIGFNREGVEYDKWKTLARGV